MIFGIFIDNNNKNEMLLYNNLFEVIIKSLSNHPECLYYIVCENSMFRDIKYSLNNIKNHINNDITIIKCDSELNIYDRIFLLCTLIDNQKVNLITVNNFITNCDTNYSNLELAKNITERDINIELYRFKWQNPLYIINSKEYRLNFLTKYKSKFDMMAYSKKFKHDKLSYYFNNIASLENINDIDEVRRLIRKIKNMKYSNLIINNYE